MSAVHPTFDIETRTWFVPHPQRADDYVEAPSIRELLTKLGDDYTAIGYTTERVPHQSVPSLGHVSYGAAAGLTRPSSPAIHVHSDKKRAPPLIPAASIDAVPPHRAFDEEHSLPDFVVKRRSRKRNTPVHIPKPVREVLSAERAKWTTLENMILDAWAAGETGPSIARRLTAQFPNNRPKITPAYVGANVVPEARLKGDPRAVVRNPAKFGKKVHGYGGLG